MEEKIINDLGCPKCKGKMILRKKIKDRSGFVKSGKIECKRCKRKYSIVDYIPRFVSKENYAKNFGFEWLRHSRIQIDKFSGLDISRKRFYTESGWKEKELKGKKILEVGCGGGRFSQIAIDSGAKVYSFDFSVAVDANKENNGIRKNFNLFQADIYEIPFEKNSFDYIFCFGVLQHTPNPEKSFRNLIKYLKKDGKIAIDIYPKTIKNMLHPRYFLRPITTKVNYKPLYNFLKHYWVPFFLPISNFIIKLPHGRFLKKAVPVDNRTGTLPISKEMIKEWAVLNTFDWLSPKYDLPQSLKNVKRWFSEAGLKNADVCLNGLILGTGRK